MLTIRPLNIYFFKAYSPTMKDVILDFGLQYSSDALQEEIRNKTQADVIVEVLGEIKIEDVLSIIEKEGLDYITPKKLKVREFINNLMYTKDLLVQNSDDKIELEKVLLKLK